jgi:hypothetical protein
MSSEDDIDDESSGTSIVYPENVDNNNNSNVEEVSWDSSDADNGSDIDEDEPIGDVDLEIVGLNSHSNGRYCSVHAVCGDHVRVGDVLRLVETVVTVDGHLEDAVKLVKITDGGEGCTVAFIPRLQINLPIVRRNINKFCVVKELYKNSTNTYKRTKSHRHIGMAGVVLLNEIDRNV